MEKKSDGSYYIKATELKDGKFVKNWNIRGHAKPIVNKKGEEFGIKVGIYDGTKWLNFDILKSDKDFGKK